MKNTQTYAAGPAAQPDYAAFFGAILALLAAAFAVIFPIMGNAVHPVVGLVFIALFAALYSVFAPALAILTIAVYFIFQNVIISIFIAAINSKDDLDFIRGYSFLFIAVTWATIMLPFLHRYGVRPVLADRFMRFSYVALFAIGLYFTVGFALYGRNAIFYLRNVATPVLLFQICYIVFSTIRVRPSAVMTCIVVLLVACGLMEFFYRDAWLTYTNSRDYWQILSGYNWQTLAYDKAAAQTREVVTDLTDTFKITLFNSPLLEEFGSVMRMFGPNMHAISFSYCMTFFAIFSLYRGRFIQAGLLLILIFLCSVKGPLILFVMVAFSWVVCKLFGPVLAFRLHCFLVAVYVLLGIYTGLNIGDFHVLGLMAGFQDFLSNPVGHGLGAGGAYSAEFDKIDWGAAQSAGRTPFPVESSIAVMLYQMGAMAFAVVGFFGWLSWKMMHLYQKTGNALHAALFLALISMIGNGFFQEEAFFAPLSLAMYLALAGAIFGAAKRESLDLFRSV